MNHDCLLSDRIFSYPLMSSEFLEPNPIKNLNRGYFFVFEGIDGSGKTTLSEKLTQFLKELGLPVVRHFEPTRGKYGTKIRSFLKGEIQFTHKELLDLFIHDRKESVQNTILPSLNEHKILILDRYILSTLAYQKNEEISLEYILKRNMDEKFPIPDRIFYIRISPEISLQRIKDSRGSSEVFEEIHLLRSISENFETSIAIQPFIDIVETIDGSKDLESVFNTIKDSILNFLSK